MTRKIFVFGSNLAGAHGGGSAAHAHRNCGAVWGEGVGHHGDSYAIPTLDAELRPLQLHDVKAHVADFLAFAGQRPETKFRVVAIGCGIAGFDPEDIAPMFIGYPANCELPQEFTTILERATS